MLNKTEHDMISVIIPVYNVEDYIEECISSVKNQTYSNIEVIIVNDGSKDESISRARTIIGDDSRFIIIDQSNQGLSAARNNGLRMAKGEYYTFVDSDDCLEENMLECLYKAILRDNADVSLCGTTLLINGELKKNEPPYSGIVPADEVISDFIYQRNGMIHSAWGKLFKRSMQSKTVFPVGRLYEDQFVMYNVFSNAKCAVCNQTSYIYRIRSNSIITAKDNIDKKTLDIMDSIDVVEKALSDHSELKKACYYKRINDSIQIVKFCIIGNVQNAAYQKAMNDIKKSSIQKLRNCGMSKPHIAQALMIKYNVWLFGKLYRKGNK